MNENVNPQETLQSLIERADRETERCNEAEFSVADRRALLKQLVVAQPENRLALRIAARATREARQVARWRRTVSRVLQERVNMLAETLHGIRLYPRPGAESRAA